jgi:hypothetical protein
MARKEEDHLRGQMWNDLGKQNLVIPIFGLTDEDFAIPEMDSFDLVFEVGTEYMKSLINNVKQLSETIVLKRQPVDPENKQAEFMFFFSDQTRGSAEIYCAGEKIQKLVWGEDTSKTFEISFALKYLHKYVQSAPSISDTMAFYVKKEKPLNIRYVFGHDLVTFTYWIAPKIED